MSSARVEENPAPQIYLDAFNFKVRVQLPEGMIPRKRPSPVLTRHLHVQSYQFDSRSRELSHAPRYRISGSTNGTRLFRACQGNYYGGPNHKEGRQGIRNQLTVEEKEQLQDLLDGQAQPCDHQLDLGLKLMDDLERDMGPGFVLPRRLYKMEFYFELPFQGDDVDLVRDRVESAIREIFGTEPTIVLCPKDANLLRYWPFKIVLNDKDRDGEVKVYRKGEFVRVETVFNSPGVDDNPADRNIFRTGIKAVRDQAVAILARIHAEVKDLSPTRCEQDIQDLIKYLGRTCNGHRLEEALQLMKRQYIEHGHFFVRPPVKDHQVMKYLLAKLETEGLVSRRPSSKVDRHGDLKNRKRGFIYMLTTGWQGRLEEIQEERKRVKRRKQRKKTDRDVLGPLPPELRPATIVAQGNAYRERLRREHQERLYRPGVKLQDLISDNLPEQPLTLGPRARRAKRAKRKGPGPRARRS